MEYINIIDKLKLLFELVTGNYLFIAVLVISLVTFIINRFKLINNKKAGLVITLTFVLCFSIILFFNSGTLFKTFDDISNLVFRNIYFPSIYVYVGIILISNVILIMSILSKNISKVYKNINLVSSFVINFLLLILLNTIGSKEIDILSTTSLYTNNYVVSLIELTTSGFILWMMILLLISIINSVLLYIDSKNMVEEPVEAVEPSINRIELDVNNKQLEEKPVINNTPVMNTYSNNSNNYAYVYPADAQVKKMNNIIEVDNTPKKVQDVTPVTTSYGYAFNDLVKRDNTKLEEVKKVSSIDDLMNIKPVMSSNVSVQNVSYNNSLNTATSVQDKYTKEDYQLFYRMLNAVKENNNGSSIVSMDDALSVNLLNKFSIKEYNLYKKMLQDVR